MVLGMVFYHPIASIFGLNPSTTAMAGDTVYWQTAFVVGLTINFIISSALRAAGDAWTPLVLNILTCVVNVPLLYVFIFGYWRSTGHGTGGQRPGHESQF